jgi:O-antigen/teichoic acid export membrane protein
MGSTIVVARFLGPAGRGEYAVAVAVAAIGVQIGNVGIHTSSSWLVARDPRLLGALLANGVLLGCVIGAAEGLLALAATWVSPSIAPLPMPILLLALVSIPIGLVYLIGQNLLLGLRSVSRYNVLELGNRLGGLAIIVVFAIAGALSSFTAYAGTVVALGAATVLTLVVLGRSAGRISPRVRLIREHLGYGRRTYVGALITFLVFRLDLLLVQAMRGPADAGQYSIAIALTDWALLVPIVTGTLLFPTLSAMPNPSERWQRARGILLPILLLELLVAAAFIAVGTPLVTFVFGTAFEPAAHAFVLMLPGVVCLSLQTILANYFFASGAPRIVWLGPAFGLIANIAFDLWLIPVAGVDGAAIASSVAYAVMLALALATFWRDPLRTVHA